MGRKDCSCTGKTMPGAFLKTTLIDGGKLMENLYNQKETCAWAKISPSTLTRWIDAGLFPAPLTHGLGRKKIWSESQLTRWANRDPPPDGTPTVTSPTKRDKDKEKRIRAARESLEKHRVGTSRTK
jgi:hypothetical protein